MGGQRIAEFRETTQRLFSFVGGQNGAWRVVASNTLVGTPLASTTTIDVLDGDATHLHGTALVLRGITSNERYVTRDEKSQLVAKQQYLARPEATCAALIPLRKSN